jgi:hypothetical protein
VDPLGLRPEDDDEPFEYDEDHLPLIPGMEPGCVNFQVSLVESFMRARLGPPCGFSSWSRGYFPDYLWDVKAAEQMAVNPEGSCSGVLLSTIGITTVELLSKGPFGSVSGPAIADRANDAFHDACSSHDYGYDLLRFAKKELDIDNILPGRRTVDSVWNSMMGRVCGNTGFFGIFNKGTCQEARTVMYLGVKAWTEVERNGLN